MIECKLNLNVNPGMCSSIAALHQAQGYAQVPEDFQKSLRSTRVLCES